MPHTHRFKIQSTVLPNNHHIETQTSNTTTTPDLAKDSPNSNPTNITGTKCHKLNAEATLSIPTKNKTTPQNSLDNYNHLDKNSDAKIPSTVKDGAPPTTSTPMITPLLWIFLIMTTITRAAALAI